MGDSIPNIVVAVAVVFLIAIALKHTYGFLAFVIICALFSSQLAQLFHAPQLQEADEVAVLIFFLSTVLRNLLERKKVQSFAGGAWFLCYIGIGVFSGVVSGVPAPVLVEGSFLAGKGLLLAMGAAQLEWNAARIRAGVRIGAVVSAMVLVMSFANLMTPGPWSHIFRRHGLSESRYGLPSIVGPFVHPVDLAQVSALIAIGAFCYRQTVRRSPWSAILLVGGAAFSLLSLRRKTWLSMPLGMAVTGLKSRTGTWLVILALALPVVGVVGWSFAAGVSNQLYDEYVQDHGEAARSVLTLGAVKVANEHVPFGAGFGRYGGSVAAVHYSPEYDSLGFRYVWGLGPPEPDSANFLTDTQWPQILGEGGYLGALAFVLGLIATARNSAYTVRSAEGQCERQFVALTTMGYLTAIIVESVASPVFTAPPSFALVFLLIGVSGSMRSEREHVEPATPELTRAMPLAE